MPNVFVLPALPFETKRIVKDKSGTLSELFELAESDGTVRRYSLQVGKSGSSEIVVAVEATGEQKISNYGWNGAALTKFLLETTGEQKVALHGKDEGNNLDALRTDPDRVPWRREKIPYVLANPVTMTTTANMLLFDPDKTASEVYDVSAYIVNVNSGGAAAVTVDVGWDDGGGGTIDNYYIRSEVVPWPGNLGWRYLGRIDGSDHIRGYCDTASGAHIHFDVRRVDIGA